MIAELTGLPPAIQQELPTGAGTIYTVGASGSVGTSGADLNMNSTSISSGATVSCSAFTITEPQT